MRLLISKIPLSRFFFPEKTGLTTIQLDKFSNVPIQFGSLEHPYRHQTPMKIIKTLPISITLEEREPHLFLYIIFGTITIGLVLFCVVIHSKYKKKK